MYQRFTDSLLDQRNLLRTMTFYVTGPETRHPTIPEDERYVARDAELQSQRGERAHIAATLVVRNDFALHMSVPDIKGVLLRTHFSDHIIKGVDASFVYSSLQYDSQWLGDSSSLLRNKWSSLHRALTTAVSGNSVFDIVIWLSTMSFAETADMSVIQVLAALYRSPEYAAIPIPLATAFNLAAGYTWKSNEIEHIIQCALHPFEDSAESNIPRQHLESEQQHVKRIEALFKVRQDTAARLFAHELQTQWPARRFMMPTSTSVGEYLDVTAAMTDIKVKCEQWYDNRKFIQYLDQVSAICARQVAMMVEHPRYILLKPMHKDFLSHDLRVYTSEEIFAVAPPQIASQRK